MLAEQYLQEGRFSKSDLYMCDGISPYYSQLKQCDATGLLLFSGESPNVDWRLYTFVRRLSQSFRHTLLFAGCQRFVSPKTHFIPYRWPIDSSCVQYAKAHDERKGMLVMITSNKKQHRQPGSKKLACIAKKILMATVTKTVPSVKLTDLYSYRMKALQYFAGTPYFDLYGRNWNNQVGLTAAERKAVNRLKPAEVKDKYSVLRQYRFALCFENCTYPGYITEKIFDCFLCRTIPVYLGAPDITDYVPGNLFIDARRFADFSALAAFLENMPEEERLAYTSRIDAYLQSAVFDEYADKNFAQTIYRLACAETGVLKNTVQS
ncbi:hypothetical protein FSB75_15945 [Flavisolibacter ginsenosidimutans]|uniref:Fucosyltransferase C-terminal domain-containing protein n=2 Tax=Flavisolibacter ginsenosidimutans TaxID=661481 RepID=A0A5B8UPN5_9BACT|nr:hypothetical protein FSB75_15945 [Flavisolibacter ginsenosidimutans]